MAAGADAAGGSGLVVGAGEEVGEASGSSPIASSRSSGVGVHRQWRSDSASPVMPPVLMSARDPHASRMDAAIEARRMPTDRPRLATAHATRARHITGAAKIGSIRPMNPLEIDGCTTSDVASTAPTISAMAPRRSSPGRAAEQQPPHENGEGAGDAGNHANGARLWEHEWREHPDQHHQDRRSHAWPQPERFWGHSITLLIHRHGACLIPF